MSKQPDRERALEVARNFIGGLRGRIGPFADALLEFAAEEAELAASLYGCNCEEFWGHYPMRGGHGPNCAIEDKEQFIERAAALRSQKTTALSNTSTMTTGSGTDEGGKS